MIRVVLDTNVLVAGFAASNPMHGPPSAIIYLWSQHHFDVVTSPAILAELDRTLAKPYYVAHRSATDIQVAATYFRDQAILVEPDAVITGVATHPEDDRVLATVVSAQADYLVTGDKQLLRLGQIRGIPILSPHAFLDLLQIKITKSLEDGAAG